MDLGVIGIVFAAIFVVELPDKTFIAALVLSTRYRPLAVWIGVGLAFLVQTLIAVTVGQAVSYLPDQLVLAVALVIFVIGAVLLLREAPRADAAEPATEESFAAKATPSDNGAVKTGLGAVTASFLVLLAAEWGDLSQLLTISLVGRYDDPVSVFIGAWGALLVVSGLACVVGRILLNHVKLSMVHYVGATVCLVFAAATAYELIR